MINEKLNEIQEQKRLVLQAMIKKTEERVNNFEYRKNPDKWLVERFGEELRSLKWSEYPGYENHEWDGTPDPLYRMWKRLCEGPHKWAGAQSATGTGKTYTLARVIFWFLDVFDDSLVVISAPKEDQLNKQVWAEVGKAFPKFKRIRPFAELQKSVLYVDNRQSNEKRARHIATTFVAGVGADEESATKAQGFHRENMLILTEETPGMPLPTLTAFTVTSNSANNRILAVGNPDSIVDPLNNFIETYNKVEGVRISGMDHPNYVLDKEVIPGCVTRQSVAMINNKYGAESAFAKSRTRGICPSQGTDSLIRMEWIARCTLNSPEYKLHGPIEDDRSSNSLGVDVANSDTGDNAALAWGKANKLVRLHEFPCPDANALAYNVIYEDHEIEEMEEIIPLYGTAKLSNMGVSANHIGVDTVGVGAGTGNAFTEKGFDIIPLQGGQDKRFLPIDELHEETKGFSDTSVKYMYEFVSLRAQMYWELREDLRLGNIILDLPPQILSQLRKELVLITYQTKSKIIVESKDDLKKKMGGKSPNMADATVYWNWCRKDRGQARPPLPFI